MKEKNVFWRDFGEGPHLFDVLENNVGQPFIVFDTETTGLDAEKDRIIQISAIKYQIEKDCEFSELGRLNVYINPGYPLPPKIVEITGITDDLLADKPSEVEAWPEIFAFFGEQPIVCGHNARSFDMRMMQQLYYRNTGDGIKAEVVDTLVMARELHHKVEVGKHKLECLAEYFGLHYGLTFHNAMDDVIATSRILRYFIEEYKQKKEEYEKNTPTLMKTDVKATWPFAFSRRVANEYKSDGSPKYKREFRRYVRVSHENRLLYIDQTRPYAWGEKDKGSLGMFDLKDLESKLLTYEHCTTLDELAKKTRKEIQEREEFQKKQAERQTI